MSLLTLREVRDNRDLRAFVNLPWRLYRSLPAWVPPLRSEFRKLLSPATSPLLARGPHALLMAWNGSRPAGRLLVGIDERRNREHGTREGYFTLFECEEDPAAAAILLGGAEEWLRARGMIRVTGPVSPTNGDDNRGLLLNGFDEIPMIQTAYTAPWYPALLEGAGYAKDLDFFAFRYQAGYDLSRLERVAGYAMKRYGFEVTQLDPKDLEGAARDVHSIYVRSMPDHWRHLSTPTLEDVRKEVGRLARLADPDFVYFARKDGEAVGMLCGLPDYNMLFRRMNGRLLPFGFLVFLLGRRWIRRVRLFMQFVVPEYRNKAVTAVLYYRFAETALRKKYRVAEASTIAEFNRESILSMEGIEGVRSRTYRIYGKDLQVPGRGVPA